MSPPPNRNFFARIAARPRSEVRDRSTHEKHNAQRHRAAHTFVRAAINRRATVTAFAKLVARATPRPAIPNAVP